VNVAQLWLLLKSFENKGLLGWHSCAKTFGSALSAVVTLLVWLSVSGHKTYNAESRKVNKIKTREEYKKEILYIAQDFDNIINLRL